VLAPLGRRLGPDPARTDVATVGGVVANNSGGMRCGVTKDSYSTLRSLTFVLPSGTRIDTATPGAAAEFEAAEPELAAGLAAIREEIRADPGLTARIRRKFEIKNTTGYRLCAFLDAEEPLEIFRRLLIGSEGTLAWIPEVVFETVAQPAVTTTAWVHFPDIDAAIAPVNDLVASGATRGRADGRARPHHRRLEHGRRAAGVERARPHLGGAPGRVRRRDGGGARRAGCARDGAARLPRDDPADRFHP
jgi:D-lactate dehydrogenase